MKNRKNHDASARTKAGQQKPTAFVLRLVVAIVVAGVGLGMLAWTRLAKRDAEEKYAPRPRGILTFNKDIVPIVFNNCAGCHRPGQSAPFSLLSFQNVKKHAEEIADVTARRYMPPWLPEHGYGEFVGERRLTTAQIGMIQQWIAEGTTEGASQDLPPLPKWSSDWQLGKPDLVLTMPETYSLVAEGRDVYRNFVIPMPITATRYVKGVEFRPGNFKIVHHAFIKLDRTAQSRRLDAQDAELGYPGMTTPAEMPAGHFLSWQPGRQPTMVPEGLAWRVDPGNDLVLQMHLNPSGKPEQLQSSVGLYFTDQAPTNTCFKAVLMSLTVDIPAGEPNYVVEDSYVLPVDVDVLAVLPHAHYLADEMKGWATLPDGTKEWLILIRHWDFNWQGDYRYVKPISLPKGTTLSMRYTFDNSSNNVHNPSRPPRPVTYGPQSKDEMAELWLQLLPRNRNDFDHLTRDYQLRMERAFIASSEYALRKNPNDAKAHTELGMILFSQAKAREAEQHFRAAIQATPDFAQAHYAYGILLRQQARLAEAKAEFETDLRLNPNDFKAHGNLGSIFFEQGNFEAAQPHFESALRLNPDDALARAGLEETLKARGTPGKRD